MPTSAFTHRRWFPSVEIDASTAFEFLMTLCIISFPPDPEDPLDVEAAEETSGWYDTMHTKASPELLEVIEQFSGHYDKIWTHLLGLAYDCPPPRDVPTFLAHLEAIEASELLLHLVGYYLRSFRRTTLPEVILQAVEGNEEARQQFLQTSLPDDADWQAMLRKLLSSDPESIKSSLLDIFRRWYEEIFRPWEPQVIPILARDTKAKRKLKQTMSPKQLIEAATSGFDYVPEPYIREVILIPSFVLRPWSITSEHHDVKIFCYPVADESLLEDDDAPPVRLMRLGKALADERRMRILKKLTLRSYTLQEVAEDFGVVKSTMNHHFVILRSAGLIRLRTSDNQYSLRDDGIAEMCELLNAYLMRK